MARGPQRRGAQCSCIGCIGLRPALLTVFQQNVCKPGCAQAGPAAHFLCSTARNRQDIVQPDFAFVNCSDVVMSVFTPLFQRAA